MNEAKNRQLRGIAFHEAGHAVVALHYGRLIGKMEIRPDDESGSTEVNWPSSSEATKVDIEHLIVFLHAGGSAQAKYDEGTIRDSIGFSAGTLAGDYAKIVNLVSDLDLSEDEETELLQRLRNEAEKILDDNWSLAEKIAGKLMSDVAIPGAELKQLIGG